MTAFVRLLPSPTPLQVTNVCIIVPSLERSKLQTSDNLSYYMDSAAAAVAINRKQRATTGLSGFSWQAFSLDKLLF
jgi:hypothetical protein